MSLEGQQQDEKSLRAVTGKTADWHELAKDCVAFANTAGGRLVIEASQVAASGEKRGRRYALAH